MTLKFKLFGHHIEIYKISKGGYYIPNPEVEQWFKEYLRKNANTTKKKG